jgi:MYXO-CTERM domain-containing protein
MRPYSLVCTRPLRGPRNVLPALPFLAVLAFLLTFAFDAHAVGSFKLKSNEIQEGGAAGWHLYVTIELPRPPLTAHQTMKFQFTKTMVYERALIDGHAEPVLNRQALQNQQPSYESLDVDFADPSGKIFKATRFDFYLTRARDFEAGEYKVELRTSDGTTVGAPATLILKGDNPVVDRRAIAFNAEKKPIKKIEGYDAGANQASNEPVAAANMSGEVTASGTAKPFIPKEGYEKTPEEEIKSRPKGCGCDVPGETESHALLPLAAIGLGLIVHRRRRTGTAAAA